MVRGRAVMSCHLNIFGCNHPYPERDDSETEEYCHFQEKNQNLADQTDLVMMLSWVTGLVRHLVLHLETVGSVHLLQSPGHQQHPPAQVGYFSHIFADELATHLVA